MSAVAATETEQSPLDGRSPFGWPLVAIGLTVTAWWTWTWSKVHRLITDHVASHGELPTDAMERAGLYADGTAAEQIGRRAAHALW